MAKIEKGPEDTPKWSHPSNRSDKQKYDKCILCKERYVTPHCGGLGCPWCSQCAAKLQDMK